jgi:hypothetical protein
MAVPMRYHCCPSGNPERVMTFDIWVFTTGAGIVSKDSEKPISGTIPADLG